jgi:nitroreductase
MNLEDITRLIKERRTHPTRFFNDKGVPKELIRQLLENGNRAPNHKNTEPWRFIVYSGEGREKFITEVKNTLEQAQQKGTKVPTDKVTKFALHFRKAPVAIAIVANLDAEHRLPEWEEMAAVSMAVQNIWLSATAAGLSVFWATPSFINLLGTSLDLKPNQKSMGFLFLGYANRPFPENGRESIENKIVWKD